MKSKRARRVQTFSVSVDPKTKAILKDRAKRLFGGNMSALIAAFAREAEKREAIDWLDQDAGGSALNDELREQLAAEFYGRGPRGRRKPAA